MYCNGQCPHLNEQTHRCRLTGERLSYARVCGPIYQWAAGFNAGLNREIHDISCAPAADVEPVRHGRWVKYAGKLICSECKKYPPMKDESGGWRTYHEWPYCPNCGAKMDGEVDT